MNGAGGSHTGGWSQHCCGRLSYSWEPALSQEAVLSPPAPLRGHWHLPMYEHPNSEPAARIYPSPQTPSAGPWSSEPCPRPWSPGPCFSSPARGDCFTDAPQTQGTSLLRAKPRPARKKPAVLRLMTALQGRTGSAHSPGAAAGSLWVQPGCRFLQPWAVPKEPGQRSQHCSSQPTTLACTTRLQARASLSLHSHKLRI